MRFKIPLQVPEGDAHEDRSNPLFYFGFLAITLGDRFRVQQWISVTRKVAFCNLTPIDTKQEMRMLLSC